jgi:hypothetical protein
MKFQRRTPSSGARAAAPVNLERKRQAEELSTRSGIPVQMAYSIVDGHTTLDAVLKAMLAREKTRKLAEQYGLPLSLAGQVARGQVPLDKVLARHRRRSSDFWRARFSAFDALAAEPRRVALLRFGKDWAEGLVTEVTKYGFNFDAGGGPEPVLKHEVKLLVADPSALEAVKPMLQTDEAVRAKSLGATADLTERMKLDKERFYEAIQGPAPIRFMFRDGHVLTGPIRWFARYEFAVPAGEAAEVVGFFHALVEWAPVPQQAEPEGELAGKHGKKKDHPKDHKKGKKGRR